MRGVRRQFKIVRNYVRTSMASIVVLLVTALLSFEAPALKPDHSNYEQYGFWLHAEAAIGYFIAVTAGAIVARGNFLVPALALAGLGWSAVVYILYDISKIDPMVSLDQIALENLGGLFIYAIAAVLGAILGRWFYKHEIQRVTNAS